MEEALSVCELSVSKYGVLRVLAEADAAVSLSRLARSLDCVKSNVTQLVDRLESSGLVVRQEDPSDRRSVRAALTLQGRRRYRCASRLLARVDEAMEQASCERALATVDDFLAVFAASGSAWEHESEKLADGRHLVEGIAETSPPAMRSS